MRTIKFSNPLTKTSSGKIYLYHTEGWMSTTSYITYATHNQLYLGYATIGIPDTIPAPMEAIIANQDQSYSQQAQVVFKPNGGFYLSLPKNIDRSDYNWIRFSGFFVSY